MTDADPPPMLRAHTQRGLWWGVRTVTIDGDGGGLPQLHILVLARDEPDAVRMRRALLRMEHGIRVTTAATLRAGLDALAAVPIGCIVTDVRLADAEGVDVVRALVAGRHELPVIVVSGVGSERLAVASMKMGVAEYVPKHERWVDELPTLVRDVLGRSVLATCGAPPAECDGPRPEGAVADEALVATTPGMHAVLALADRAARSRVPVLVEGETGTGKELVARAIHQRGAQAARPFLVQNCAAITESLLESELFGHVRGAFTGADRDRRGLFEEAGDGTVFLDELGEAPAAVQAKLLRVLQHDEVKAVGADRVRRVTARIVAATNRPLEADVRTGRFRADLYYRLTVFPIRVPPLRHRTPDVLPLVSHFITRFEARECRETGGIDDAAVAALQRYGWPGNVRELENEVHRLVLSVGRGCRIRPEHLARRIRDAAGALADVPLDRLLERVEIALIRERLQRTPTKSAAARSLGITREALYAKMRRLGIAGAEAARQQPAGPRAPLARRGPAVALHATR